MTIKIWHDDCRYPPDDSWQWAPDNKTMIMMLLAADNQGIEVTEVSLDHDLGERPGNLMARGDSPDGDGTDLAWAMYYLKINPKKVKIHSWNRDGARRMADILEAAGSDVTVKEYVVPPGNCLLCGRSKGVCGDCLNLRNEAS